MKPLVLFLSLLLTTQVTFAAGSKGKHHERGEKLKKELGLSDEQLAKVKDIRKERREELKGSRQKFKDAKEAFKTAMKDPKVSNEDLTAKFEAFQKERDSFQRARFGMMLEMRKVLTPEQLEKFTAMKREWKKDRKGKKDRAGKKDKKLQ